MVYIPTGDIFILAKRVKHILVHGVNLDWHEGATLTGFSKDIRNRFIPYIQLHEFESILFSDIGVFDRNFEEEEFLNYEYLVSTINDNPNPELINNGITTAPSKRLDNSIKGYKKVIYGALLAHDIGLITIRQKCSHFNNWIEQLENI